MKRVGVSVVLMMVLHLSLCGQQTANGAIAEIINDIFESYTAESELSPDYESFYNDLMYLAEYPLNVNNTTKTELGKMPFLTDVQIENILTYTYTYGALHSVYELQLIEGLDMTDIRRMLPFVRIGNAVNEGATPTPYELLHKTRGELQLRCDRTFELKDGYKERSDSLHTTPYAGDPFYTLIKLNVSSGRFVSAGITAEKDAGEAFDGAKHKGFDFYSGYVQASNMLKLSTLVIGDFRAGFGQGLVVNTGYSPSSSAYVLNAGNRETGLRHYSSGNEFNFFRGIGCSLPVGKTSLSVFYSNRELDADTTGGVFSAFDQSGLHRTESELAQRAKVGMQTIGGNLSWQSVFFKLGLTAVRSSLNVEMMPDFKPYNQGYFRGKNQTTIGFDYRFRLDGLNLFGETARTQNGAWATVNGLLLALTSRVGFVTLFRNYSANYAAFYANAFAAGSRVNNETGIYTAVELRPVKFWKLAVAVDSYRFPWLKYGVNAPSVGANLQLRADFNPGKYTGMYWRIKFSQNQKNESGDQTVRQLYALHKASLRYQLDFSKRNFSSRSLVELSYADSTAKNIHVGFTAYQDLSYSFLHFPLTINARCVFFDSPDYDTRFYLYEKDILSAFSIPVLSGTGLRYYFNVKCELNKHLSVWLKLAQTVYDVSRQQTGSGYEAIAGNKKTDIRLLLKYDF